MPEYFYPLPHATPAAGFTYPDFYEYAVSLCFYLLFSFPPSQTPPMLRNFRIPPIYDKTMSQTEVSLSWLVALSEHLHSQVHTIENIDKSLDRFGFVLRVFFSLFSETHSGRKLDALFVAYRLKHPIKSGAKDRIGAFCTKSAQKCVTHTRS